MGAEVPEGLEPVQCPFAHRYLLDYFHELCRIRVFNGFGMNRLSGEILTWQSLRQIRLTTFELDAIWHLDDIYVAHHNQKK